jgi:hypothetical protein
MIAILKGAAMPHRTTLVGAAAIAVAAAFTASLGWSLAGPPARARAARPAPPPPAQREMARAAGEVLRILQVQEDIGGRALTPDFVTEKLEWSRRRVLALRQLDVSHEEKLAALRTHLDLAKQMRDSFKYCCWKNEASDIPIECANYFAAEAELWVAEAEGRPQ